MEGIIGEQKGPHQIYHLYCMHCKKKLPQLLNQQQFGNASDLEDLIARWDEIGMVDTYIANMLVASSVLMSQCIQVKIL